MINSAEDQNSLWGVIKESIIHIIRAETSTTGGKLNLLFGVLAILFLFACFIPSIAETILEVIIKNFKPDIELGLPPYVLVLMFFGVLVYFGICVKYVDSINIRRENLDNINSQE